MSGRVKRTPETAEAICVALAEGRTLRSFDGDPTLPSSDFVLDWAEDDQEFAGQYARARARGWDNRAEAALERAHVAEDAARGRLAFDAERWFLGKMAPKKYGDKLQHADADGEKLVAPTFILQPVSAKADD